jgi:hypothetical protein
MIFDFGHAFMKSTEQLSPSQGDGRRDELGGWVRFGDEKDDLCVGISLYELI